MFIECCLSSEKLMKSIGLLGDSKTLASMSSMSQKGIVESGAQLLARLGPRPTLQGSGAAELLGFEPSSGDVVEIYGGEGVGKTELLLNLVASLLSRGVGGRGDHHGNQAEVVWVDCDLKLSVLRLALLLEQRIVGDGGGQTGGSMARGEEGAPLSADDRRSTDSKTPRSFRGGNADFPNSGRSRSADSGHPCSANSGHYSCANNGTSSSANSSLSSNVGSRYSGIAVSRSTSNASSGNNTPPSAVKRKAEEMEMDDPTASDTGPTNNFQGNTRLGKTLGGSGVISESHPAGEEVSDTRVSEGLSAEEVESRVCECLGRVHVARCSSSPQLVCTLRSLESFIAATRNIAVLIVDSASAFFWSDKCSDFNATYLNNNMAHVASVLKSIAESYGVFVVVTKQALMKPRQKEKLDSIDSPSVKSSVFREEATGHVEFLGAAWSRVVTKRLVCSKSVLCQAGVEMTQYTLTGPGVCRQFTINEAGVHGGR